MKKILSIIGFLMMVCTMYAVPAHPGILDYIQPNGDTLHVRLIGDERFHFYTTADGLLLQKNEKGFFCYAVWQEYSGKNGETKRKAVALKRKAHNEADRSRCENKWIIRKQIPKR